MPTFDFSLIFLALRIFTTEGKYKINNNNKEIGRRITMATEDTKETTYLFQCWLWLSRMGMLSPCEILCPLSNTLPQLFTFFCLQYLMPPALCWWAKKITIMPKFIRVQQACLMWKMVRVHKVPCTPTNMSRLANPYRLEDKFVYCCLS